MLSYQHSYHAGCFADVMKHLILTRLLHYLTQKDKPLFYLDTHAGRGLYDLQDEHALKTQEAQGGIYPLWEKRDQLSALCSLYIDTIACLNEADTLRHYPGSPQIAISLLRQQDRLFFCELHPTEFQYLGQLAIKRRTVFLKKEDGFGLLDSLLPPIERRGLVFIDPSYERKTEYEEVVQWIKKAHNRCASITYCVWYPLIRNQLPYQFLKKLKTIEPNKFLHLEFYKTTKSHLGMTGSGLWIINPPYILAQESEVILNELTQCIQPGESSYLISPQEWGEGAR
jgi:23S rRNA (adenine2030-N6)-methyltransferase